MRLILVLGFLTAALGGAVVALPAIAQSCDGPCVIIDNPGPGSGGGGGSGKSYSPAEPFNPFGDAVRKLPDGSDPKLPGYVAGLPVCNTQLGELRRVRAAAIRAVDHGVSVSQICENKNLTDQQDGVASLRSALKRNKAMVEALRKAGGFVADDVVAVVLDGEGAKLYVHHNKDSAGGGGTTLSLL